MPGNEKIANIVHKRFDSLTTAELKEILYQDSRLPEDECLDVETTLYISKLLSEREDSGADKFTPVDEAWENFNKHYRSMESDGKSLYDDCKTTVQISDKSNRRQPWHSVLRVAYVAAALLILMFAGSLTAYAMGYDLWGAVAEWTKDTFGFELKSKDIHVETIYEDFDAVKKELAKQGVAFDVLPQWLPSGYLYKKTELVERPGRKTIYLEYLSGENHIGLTISLSGNQNARAYEKDENLVQVYELDGIQNYIICNYAETSIIWGVGNCECSIIGVFSPEEAINIINSVYGR